MGFQMNESERKEIDVLKCVANEIRYKILRLLKEEELCVNDIMENLEEDQTLISHHLKRLYNCGLVDKKREGRKIRYSIADEAVFEFMRKVGEISETKC